ncbi:MAG: NAD(P)/FAD-dependent oxidoreductase [Candidatus Limnocylindrales bacterium]
MAIIGAGPAGAALATRLARAGLDVVLLERAPAWRWRAGGVFASPAAVTALRRAGLDAPTIDRVSRAIPAMRLETAGGAVVRLTYGTDQGGPTAVGFDRSALDPALVELANAAGVTVRQGLAVRDVVLDPAGRRVSLAVSGSGRDGRAAEGTHIAARVVVGADGPHSRVARAADVARAVRMGRRVGLSYHLPDPRGDATLEARMRVIRDGYVGIAPVPGGRVNIGIVLGGSWARQLAAEGAATLAARIVRDIPATADDAIPWRDATPCESIAGAAPLGVRVTRRAGPGWFLVGDAAGFLDPFTGEGLHRALISTELAAPAIVAAVRGRADPARAAAVYDRAMRRRFAAKDAVSWLVQTFLTRPMLFEYAARRLATRPDVRATMGLVMGDLIPAARGLDPRFLAALLAP